MESNENAQNIEQTAAINNETQNQKIYYSNGIVTIGSNFWTTKSDSALDAVDVVIPKKSVSFAGRVRHIAIIWFILAAIALYLGIQEASKSGWDRITTIMYIEFVSSIIFLILGFAKSYDKVVVETHCGDGGFKLPLSWNETKDCLEAIKKCLNDK